jgi:hypothetical protein
MKTNDVDSDGGDQVRSGQVKKSKVKVRKPKGKVN